MYKSEKECFAVDIERKKLFEADFLD